MEMPRQKTPKEEAPLLLQQTDEGLIMEHTFYMVYHEGDRAPTKKHPSIGGAHQEAERIVRKDGDKVYLLEAIQSVLREDSFIWMDIEPEK